jgi:hypothetical protein
LGCSLPLIFVDKTILVTLKEHVICHGRQVSR